MRMRPDGEKPGGRESEPLKELSKVVLSANSVGEFGSLVEERLTATERLSMSSYAVGDILLVYRNSSMFGTGENVDLQDFMEIIPLSEVHLRAAINFLLREKIFVETEDGKYKISSGAIHEHMRRLHYLNQ